jgi:hypothetical protein
MLWASIIFIGPVFPLEVGSGRTSVICIASNPLVLTVFIPMLFDSVGSGRCRSTPTMAVGYAGLLVVSVMVFHNSLCHPIARELGLQHREQIFRSTNKMYRTRCFQFVVCLTSLFLLANSMLLQE